MQTRTLLSGLAAAVTIGALAATTSWAAGNGPNAKPPSNPTATPVPTAVPCPTCPPVHVLAVNLAGGKNANNSTYAVCRVFIGDELDNQIAGATVTHQWTGAVNTTQVDVTKPQGTNGEYGISTWARLDNGPKCVGSGGVIYTCTVQNVVPPPGYRYAPEFNVQSSDTDDACNPFD